MNLAEPAPSVEPANATPAEASASVDQDEEYKVEPAPNVSDRFSIDTHKVEPAVTISDPRQFAPINKLNQPHRNPDLDIPVSKLRESASGVFFESEAGVTRGIQVTFTRRFLPFLHDDRDFTSFGEIRRYVVIKDNYCFVYGQATDPVPIFTIPIETLQAVRENPNKPNKYSLTISPMANTNEQAQSLETVLLLDARGKLVYQFCFDVSKKEGVINSFIHAIEHANALGKANDVGKKIVKT